MRPDGVFRVPSTATAIIIDGCARLYLLPDTVNGLANLRNVELRNIRHVHFSERSLAWSPFPREHELSNPGLRIYIHNSTIDEIASHAIKGRVDDIVISNSKINMIRPFAFSSLTGVNNIELIDNVYDNIDIQAFKKFTTQNFIFRGGIVTHSLPSRFLSDIEIRNLLRIDGVKFKSISSLAFLANSPKRLIIERNIIEILEGDAFHISMRGPITFRNNTIGIMRKGALMGLNVERDVLLNVGLQELLLDNNTIADLTPNSLFYNRSAVTLRIDTLNIDVTCNCDLAEGWQETIMQQGGAITCWYVMEDHFMSIPSFVDTRCGQFKEYFWIFVVVGVVLAIIVGLLIAFFVIRRERQKKKKIPVVMPDGKTYKETEIHILMERAELLTTDL